MPAWLIQMYLYTFSESGGSRRHGNKTPYEAVVRLELVSDLLI